MLRETRIKHLRGNPRCFICGKIKTREVHHIFSAKYFPKLINNPSNLVTLCREHHSLYHNTFNGGWKKVSTRKKWNKFMKIVNTIKELNK